MSSRPLIHKDLKADVIKLLEKNDSQRTGLTQATTIQPEKARLVDSINNDRISRKSCKSIVSKVSPTRSRMNVINEDSIFEMSATKRDQAKNSQRQLPIFEKLREMSQSK